MIPISSYQTEETEYSMEKARALPSVPDASVTPQRYVMFALFAVRTVDDGTCIAVLSL